MSDRCERKAISQMKGDGSEFSTVNHLPPGNEIGIIFSMSACIHIVIAATHTTCRAATRTAKRQGDSHFFPNDTESLRADRIIDLERQRESLIKREKERSTWIKKTLTRVKDLENVRYLIPGGLS